MSLSAGKVAATVIVGVIVAAAVHFYRSRSQQYYEYSYNEAPLCLICYQQFQTGKTSQELPCGHVFHKKCISSVLENQVTPSCPRCRRTFSPKEAAW